MRTLFTYPLIASAMWLATCANGQLSAIASKPIIHAEPQNIAHTLNKASPAAYLLNCSTDAECELKNGEPLSIMIDEANCIFVTESNQEACEGVN